MKDIEHEKLEINETSEPYNAFSFSYDNTDNVATNSENEEENKNVEVTQNNENAVEVEKNNEENTEAAEEPSVSQETKTFSSSEIQEMIDKLDKMDNVEQNPEFASMYEKIFGKLPASTLEEQKKEKEKINAYELIKDDNKVSLFEDIEEYKKPTYKLVGIAFNTYIIIEIGKELYIIDQHAAHERVMYEKVKENYYAREVKDSQMLLLPDIITLTHKEMDILKDNQEMFTNAGFAFEEFGENTIKLTGVPDICLDLDTKELFLETLDEINTVARTAKQEIEEKFIATVACKAAVKANMDLTPEEVDNLMNELLKLPNPFTCPHGRPTAIRMDQNDIEKKFARRK
jgi:DNA mismatch repair protein MutL